MGKAGCHEAVAATQDPPSVVGQRLSPVTIPKPVPTIDEQTEVINSRMFRNRLDQWREHHKGWQTVDTNSIRPQRPREFIRGLLERGMKVKAGYYPTSVRGYHRHIILWKNPNERTKRQG